MDDETRTAFATMAESIAAGFARMDRYFELQQAQHIEFRTEVNANGARSGPIPPPAADPLGGARSVIREKRAEID